MATKSKLESAVERQIESLNDAQKELVKSQLSVYRRNDARMADIKDQQSVIEASPAVTLDDVRAKQALRSSLSYEYNQLATANSRIASDLFDLLEE